MTPLYDVTMSFTMQILYVYSMVYSAMSFYPQYIHNVFLKSFKI
jgi:hypothetical protein